MNKNLFDMILKEGAAISGVDQYENGELSGKTLAGDGASKGIRDVTPGSQGRGQAEVDKTGVYVGVPMGPDKTAWANPTAVRQIMPQAGQRLAAFQKAYAAAPANEKAQMQDWSPEKPDMSINLDGRVVDNNTKKVMPTAATTQAQPKSSILQKLGLKESNTYQVWDGFEADVDFWYGQYYDDVDAGVNDPDVGIIDYIAGKIDEEYPSTSPENYDSLRRQVAYYILHKRESTKSSKNKLFERLLKMNEATTEVLANAIAKKLSQYDGTDAGAKEVINFITSNVGTAVGQGTEGLIDDIKSNLRDNLSPVNKAIAFAVMRSKNPNQALQLLDRYRGSLGDIDLDAVKSAIQMANQNQNMSLSDADKAARQ